MRLVPGALIGVLVGTLVAYGAASTSRASMCPHRSFARSTCPNAASSPLVDPAMMAPALAIAFIASAETLLSAAAVDRMHDGVRTNYNKELRAQGIGNLLCGVRRRAADDRRDRAQLGQRPGRRGRPGSRPSCTAPGSSASSRCCPGCCARSRWRRSAGPGRHRLAAGQPEHVRHLFHHYGVLPAGIWAATLVTVVATDLLTGVLVGIGLSLLELMPHMRRLRLKRRRASRRT
jgi:MFS superfamily sulfate permease-like transporter